MNLLLWSAHWRLLCIGKWNDLRRMKICSNLISAADQTNATECVPPKRILKKRIVVLVGRLCSGSTHSSSLPFGSFSDFPTCTHCIPTHFLPVGCARVCVCLRLCLRFVFVRREWTNWNKRLAMCGFLLPPFSECSSLVTAETAIALIHMQWRT